MRARLWIGVFVLLAACKTSSATPTPATTGVSESFNELNIYNWDTYIDPDILTDFEQKFGASINYETFENNEAMYEVVRAGSSDYDIIVPSSYTVAVMRREGLLTALDKNNIPNLKNLDPAFASPIFDPGGRYCVAYQWGTVGIGYNIKSTGREISSWADFFDPAFAGRVAMMDDQRIVLGAVLIHLGYSPNTTDTTEIAQARDFLLEHADHIVAYLPDTGQDLLAAGELDMVLEWNGDILRIMEDNPDIRYVVPERGSVMFADNMCIPVNAPHNDLAEAFINYILEPEVGATLSNYVHFASPNQAAVPFLDEADRDNPAIYPPQSVREHLFFIADLGIEANKVYEQAFEQVLSEHNSP